MIGNFPFYGATTASNTNKKAGWPQELIRGAGGASGLASRVHFMEREPAIWEKKP
jgi:hypothetical protein